MNMKKIIAGVAAAALTATSLAVVNVSADETKTYSFIQNKNNITFTYTQELTARSNVDLTDLFSVSGEKTYEFSLGLNSLNVSDLPGSDQWIQWNEDLTKLSYVGTTTISVTGRNDKTKQIETVTTKAKYNKDTGYMQFRAIGSDSSVRFLEDNDLDVGRFEVITKVAISQNFKTGDVTFTIPDGKVGFVIKGQGEGNTYADAGLAALFERAVEVRSFKNNPFSTGGYRVDFDTIYGLENNAAIYGDTNSGSLNVTLLQWANDIIKDNKGVKIRFTFGPKDASTGEGLGWLDNWSNTSTGTRPWYVGGSTESSSKANDMVLAVNGHSSNQLRQEVVMTQSGSNYVAEFDWDTVMAASPTTVAGHVTSIAFALNGGDLTANVPKGDNYDNIAKVDAKGDYAVLRQIDIIVPDQTTIPGGSVSQETEKQQLKAVDSQSGAGVRVVSTDSALNNGTIEFTYDISTNGFFYNIKLIDNGTSVQPKGDLTIELYIPKSLQGRTLKVTELDHISSDGTTSKDAILNLDTYKTDNFLKIKVNKLSNIGGTDLFEEEETTTEAPETTTEAPETTTEAPATTTEAPATTAAPAPAGDKNANTGVAIAIVPAVIAAAGVIISKKRK